MAKRAGTAKASASGGSSGSAEDRLIDAALSLAARQGWGRTGLGEIASEAGLPLHEAYAAYSSKVSLLNGLRKRIDRATLKTTPQDGADTARDRLFDILMRRFEALRPHRQALNAILRESLRDPVALLDGIALLRSMAWMLEGAGVSTGGWSGRIRVHILTGLYLSVMRVFLSDDSADLGATMAALDRGLRRAERALRLSGAAPAAPANA